MKLLRKIHLHVITKTWQAMSVLIFGEIFTMAWAAADVIGAGWGAGWAALSGAGWEAIGWGALGGAVSNSAGVTKKIMKALGYK